MDLRELKQEFGQGLVFWGGGVESKGSWVRVPIADQIACTADH